MPALVLIQHTCVDRQCIEPQGAHHTRTLPSLPASPCLSCLREAGEGHGTLPLRGTLVTGPPHQHTSVTTELHSTKE